jgi:hypothetical protein
MLKQAYREQTIDRVRALLILMLLLGHANLFFNPLRPTEINEGTGGQMIPWEHAVQGIIRLLIHHVAVGLFLLSGYGAAKFQKVQIQKKFYFKSILMVIADTFVVSAAWTFPASLFQMSFTPNIEALGCLGFCRILSLLARKLKTATILGCIVSLKAAQLLVLEYVGVSSTNFLVNFMFLPSGHAYYKITYDLAGWLTIFLVGFLSYRVHEKFKVKISQQKHLAYHIGSALILTFFIVQMLKLWLAPLKQSASLRNIFQLQLYPPSLAYVLLGAGIFCFTIAVAKKISSNSIFGVFLAKTGKHGFGIYVIHGFVFGTINYAFSFKAGAGSFLTAAGIVGCLILASIGWEIWISSRKTKDDSVWHS